jgi:ABC-type transport system involved in multi-copper enzyme maturation permease subunit
MSALVSAELLKLRTTRTALGFLIAIVVLTLVAQGAGFATSDFSTAQDLREGMAGAGVAATFLLILGIIGTTGEYRHGTITSTLLASPDRRRLVAAKAIAYAITGALLGLAAMLATFAMGAIWLSVRDAPLGLLEPGDYLALAAQGMLSAALSGAVGVAIGAIVRNQVAAVVGTLIYLFVLEPLVGLIPGNVAAFTIGGAQGGLEGAPFGDALDPLPAGLVLAAWALVLGLAGAELEERRDVV